MDTIKREDAIRIAEYPQIGALTKEERVSLIMDIPSAEKQGEWIIVCDAEGEGDNLYRCSICGHEYGCQEYDLPNYCGTCGARVSK